VAEEEKYIWDLERDDSEAIKDSIRIDQSLTAVSRVQVCDVDLLTADGGMNKVLRAGSEITAVKISKDLIWGFGVRRRGIGMRTFEEK
jgi:hypothetical protein